MSSNRFSLTIFGLVFLQTLVEVWAKLWAKKCDHLVPAHLAQGGPVHSTAGQTEGARIKLSALYMVANPVQNILCCPAVRAYLSIQLTCRNRGSNDFIFILSALAALVSIEL